MSTTWASIAEVLRALHIFSGEDDQLRQYNISGVGVQRVFNQTDAALKVCTLACPSTGYSYLQKARSTGRGGGLATIYRSDLDLSYLPLPELSSCECLPLRCKLPSPVTILLIYRPPKPNPSFMPEMYNLLSSLCTTSTNILIFGDVNIHVNNPSCRFAAEFLQLLDCFSLRQLVDVPTHTRGHTTDLVITDSAPDRNLSVYDLGVSDHKVVSMELPIMSLSIKPKCQICFRNLKNINPKIMTVDLKNLLHTDLPSVIDAVDFYNKTLSSILDLHAPVKTRTVTFSHSAPWFTAELREIKAAGRALEHRYKAIEGIVRKMKPSTCALDPFLTVLVKANISAISPLITTVINHSVQAGLVPSVL
ncbi:hypothetical protein AOLI_G00104500 [Acnodon oligacanthus]